MPSIIYATNERTSRDTSLLLAQHMLTLCLLYLFFWGSKQVNLSQCLERWGCCIEEGLRITTLGATFKLRISFQISEGPAHAVMKGHQWMSPSEHTNGLSGLFANSIVVCFSLEGKVEGDVGLQMYPVPTDPSALSLHPEVESGIVECFAKQAFIYKDGVHWLMEFGECLWVN